MSLAIPTKPVRWQDRKLRMKARVSEMAATRPNVVILRTHLDEVKRRVAEAGIKAPNETSIDDTRVRLQFASGTDSEVVKFLATIPREAFGQVGIVSTPELLAELQEARAAGPDAVKELMAKLADKARSQT